MNLKIIFILTFVKWSSGLDTGVLLVDRIRRNFFALEDELWTYVLKQNKDNSVDPGIEILKRLKEFDQQMKELPQDILYGMKVPKKSEYFLLLFSDVRVIYDLYEKFRRYQIDFLYPSKKDHAEYTRDITINGLVNDILYDPKNNVKLISRQIQNQSISLIRDLVYKMSGEFACESPTQPEQQVIYNLYNLIATTELKGYVMTQFALMASRLQERGNYSKISMETRKEYKKWMEGKFYFIHLVMNVSKSMIYRCDPKNHIEGVTYDQVTRLIQAHVQNEVDLNPSRSCTETCGKYSYTSGQECYDSDSAYCKSRKPCKGNLYNCKFLESHMTACISPVSSTRRYEYIKLSGGAVLGHENRCEAKNIFSWTRWFVHCSTCLCYCDEQGALSDRYFNLRPTTSDVNNNKVVTGLRLIKLDRIFHVQIQEGKLLPHGYIDQSTINWVPIKRYSIFEKGIRNGIDYHTLDYEHRTLYLDNLSGKEHNHIVTGARFVLINKHLQFQITVTPFNFTTGKLHTYASYEVVKKEEGARGTVYFNEPDIPTKSPPSSPYSYESLLVNFQATDLYKDAAQTTIPFIDIQPVFAEPAVPLKSAGIYFKGKLGYGGFIGISANTYDYSNNLKLDFPGMVNREENIEESYEVLAN